MNRSHEPVILQPPEKRWECPSCGMQSVSRETNPHMRMHPCKALNGFNAPMVEVTGTELKKNSARHRLNVRDDYVGDEIVTYDNDDRPIMSLSTDYADGHNDLVVFAPHVRMAFGEWREQAQ